MTLLSDTYTILDKIGVGSFGEVYLAESKHGGFVAAKVEDKKKPEKLHNEYLIYKYLHKKGFVSGLPKVYNFIQTAAYNIMFMQLLGPSLEDLFKQNGKFTTSTILAIGEKLVILLERLHNANYLHRDIKPNNFLIGRSDNEIYMMDFGLSKKWCNNNVHIPFRDGKSLVGTARYASVNMHNGIEPTRRDDLEAVGYMLLYFYLGVLPWQNLPKRADIKQVDQIGLVKTSIGIDTLCVGVPDEIKLYLTYCRGLSFDSAPDYDYLKKLFAGHELEWVKNPR